MKIIILVLVVLGLVGLIAGGGYLYKKSQEEKYAITLESSICNIAEYGTKKEMEKMLPKNKNIPLEKVLNIAIINGNKEIIDFLISKGAKTDSLAAAIALGKKNEVENYFKQSKESNSLPIEDDDLEYVGVDLPVNSYEDIRVSNLYIAAANNQVEIARFLIESELVDVNDGLSKIVGASGPIVSGERCYYHETPLQIARKKGYNEMVQLLLGYNASSNYNGLYDTLSNAD